MAEKAFDTRGARRRALVAERNADFFPLNDLPNDVLVSVFAAARAPTWVRRTFPCVCKAWNELYRSKDASPLHETLVVDFDEEVQRAAAAAAREGGGRRAIVADPYRAIEWASRHAGSVRKLHVYEDVAGFGWESAEYGEAWLARLVALVGPHVTDVFVSFGELCKGPFWKSLRDFVVPAGRLRSFGVRDCIDFDSSGPCLEALGQLAGSLEELLLLIEDKSHLGGPGGTKGLPRFPESLLALKKLRRLVLGGHPRIKAIPARISSLEKLEDLDLRGCDLSSLPKELGELSGLTQLILSDNLNIGNTRPADEAFPAELGGMKSLRGLHLHGTGLRTVPAFIGELKSLETLTLCCNYLSSVPKELGELSRLTKLVLAGNNLGTARPAAAAAIPAELGRIKSLRELYLDICGLRTFPALVGELEPLEVLDLRNNDFEVDSAALDALLKHCRSLRELRLSRTLQQPHVPARPWTAE